jgi:hypothetical protein
MISIILTGFLVVVGSSMAGGIVCDYQIRRVVMATVE